MAERRRNRVTLNVVRPRKKNSVVIEKVDAQVKVKPADSSRPPLLPDQDDAETSLLEPAHSAAEPDTSNSESESVFTRRKLKAAEAWEELRESTLHAAVETMGLPDILCCNCHDKPAEVRCMQCGPTAFFCRHCTILLHKTVRLSHTPEIWKESYFCAFDIPIPPVKSHWHNCTGGASRKVTCFHLEGPPKVIDIEFCSCVEDAVTLVHLQYWPATPTRPSTAFSFQLLDWLEAILLECQVSLSDISAAMEFLHSSGISAHEVKHQNFYPGIIDAFEEYRFMKNSVRSIDWIYGDKKKLTTCPACPKESGTLVVSMDALFGLCRKKAAGSSVRQPLYNGLMFEDQDKVNHYIQSYQSQSGSADQGKECSEFLAGNVLRSRSRFKALDETGVMGVSCRHEFPLFFINLYHGERIAYAVFLLEELKSRFPHHDVKLLYDVACTLQRHLQSNGRHDLLSFLSALAIPIFHCYGHKASCQINMSPRYIEGFGLTDGEVMERLWSHMRRFSRMTKEMRPSHRIDVLTDALIYCGQKAAANLVKLLPQRLKRAKAILNESSNKLDNLIESSPVHFDVETVRVWISNERNSLSSEAVQDTSSSWTREYLSLLKSKANISACLERSPNAETSSVLSSKLLQMETKLQEVEQSHRITQRWQTNSPEYQSAEQLHKAGDLSLIRQKIEQSARERWFLLSMKAKYADGHALAVRLSRRITVVSSQLKAMISQHNMLTTAETQKLTWESANDLNAHSIGVVYPSHPTVPASLKKESCQAVLLMDRAKEEISMINEEMNNVFDHYMQEHSSLSNSIDGRQSAVLTPFNKGSLAVLHTARHSCEKRLAGIARAFLSSNEQIPDSHYTCTSSNEYDGQKDDLSSVREVNIMLNHSEDSNDEESEDEELLSTLLDNTVAEPSRVEKGTDLFIPTSEMHPHPTVSSVSSPGPITSHLVIPRPSSVLFSESSSSQVLTPQPVVTSSSSVLPTSHQVTHNSLTSRSFIRPLESVASIPQSDLEFPTLETQSQCDSDDEMPMISQEWRKNRFERTEFLYQLQQSSSPQSILTEEEKVLLSKVVEPDPAPHRYSYRKIPKRNLMSVVEVSRTEGPRKRYCTPVTTSN